MNIRSFICVFDKFKKNATLFQLNAVVQGLAIMTALPAYPISKVGRSSLRVLLILLAVTLCNIRTNNRGLLGVNNSDR